MNRLDGELGALIDGELTAAQSDALARRLAAEPDLAARLNALRAADKAAALKFSAVLAEPVPLALVRAMGSAPERRSSPVRSGVIAASIGAGLGVAATVGMLNLRPTALPPPAWTDQIAQYHRIYAAEDRHLVEVSANEAAHIRTWLGERIGRAFTIPDLSDNGLTFRGARLLAADGKAVAQLVYTDAAGQMFALCLTARPGAEDEPYRDIRLAELDAVVWRHNEIATIMIGPRSGIALRIVAENAARQLDI